MTNNQVPKVSIKESIGTQSALAERGLGTVIPAIIWTSEKGAVNTEYKFSSVSEAEAKFGSNTAFGADLVKLIKRAFDEGASKVIGISIGTPTLWAANETLTAVAEIGADRVDVGAGASNYTAGDIVYLGTNNTYENEEKIEVNNVVGTEVIFTSTLKFKHFVGETLQEVTAKASTDYETAIDVIALNEEKTIVVCEDSSDAVATLMVAMVATSYNNASTPCVYFRWPKDGDTASTVATSAKTLNNNRTVMVYPNLVAFSGRVLTGGETAAALAWVVARNGLPKLNHNFSEFVSVGWVASKVADMDALITNGVTPIRLKFSAIQLVRFVTTYSNKGWVEDTTWREASVRTNVDYIEKAIHRRLQAKFLQSGNTPETRLAIKTECVTLLETFRVSNVIVADEATGQPAYRDPVVTTDVDDDTKIDVQIELSPSKPLNFITLNFKVIL